MSSNGTQNHITLNFPLKSPMDAKAVAQELPPLMPALFQREDEIGTIHYSRFTVLSDKTLLFLADFDGEFSQLMLDLAKQAGSAFDAIFEHVDKPPPKPAANDAPAFAEWAADHLLHPAYVYSAYPGPTVKEIKALAAAADVQGASQLLPFLVILPARSRLASVEMRLLIRAMGAAGRIARDLASVGTPHFVQFVPLEDDQMGFFTVYDGSFDKYIADFTKSIGPVFDTLFKFTKGAPPSPCSKHLQEFIDFASTANRAPSASTKPIPA
jgi:hypothetical protein